MIRIETIGQLDVAKNNPVLKSQTATANYSFITDDGDLYLIANTITGDNAYVDDNTIAAGDYLNGFLVKAWEGQKLIADEKHIAYASNKSYADIVAGTTLMKANAAGKLEVINNAPTSGVYFKVTDKVTLTQKAVKIKVIVVDASGSAGATTLGGLTDVDTTGATSGQVLKYDGTSWKPAADATE